MKRLKTQLLWWLLKPIHKIPVHNNKVTDGELAVINKVSYEAMIESISSRSTRAQAIFLYQYIQSLTPIMRDVLVEHCIKLTDHANPREDNPGGQHQGSKGFINTPRRTSSPNRTRHG